MRHLSLLVIATLLLSACGFHLRGAGALGESISNVYVSSDNIHAPLSRTLRDRLKSHKVALLDTPEEQATILYLHPEKMDRSLLSLFSTGQVAEYELNYQVTFEVKLPGQEARLYSFDLSREYQDDPNAVLAKSREMNLILDEMRKQAADRIIRQLGQLSPPPL